MQADQGPVTAVASSAGESSSESADAKKTKPPSYDSAAPLPTGEPPQPAPSVEQYPRGNGELILVVDDEAAVRFIAAQILTRFGYRVLVAENGIEGLAIFAQHRSEIALVITDMVMPVMDGPAMVAALKQVDPCMPVLVASGSNAYGDRTRFIEQGVTHFLPKPYTAYALLEMVSAMLAAKIGSRMR